MEERLTPEELAYHRRVQADLAALQAAWQHWAGHLSRAYRIGPHDTIHEDGTVERGAVTGEPEGEVIPPAE